MSRVLAIDYGTKRVGIAVTDPLKIISNGLTTIETKFVIDFLKSYLLKEKVECIVVGKAMRMHFVESDIEKEIIPFIKELTKYFPTIKIEREDERFTSKIAQKTMLDGGLKKKARQNKALVDQISATIILQSYMERINRL